MRDSFRVAFMQEPTLLLAQGNLQEFSSQPRPSLHFCDVLMKKKMQPDP